LVKSLQKVLNAEQAKMTFFGLTVNEKTTILSWFTVCSERKNISLRKNCQQTNNTKKYNDQRSPRKVDV
jgi:hypothetical protein